MEGTVNGIPVFAKLRRFLEAADRTPAFFILGVAYSGGVLPRSCRNEVVAALSNGMHVVNGLHQQLSDDDEFRTLARQYEVDLLDIRKPRPTAGLRFWTGDVEQIPAVIIPVLGTDCAVGKRTTARFLWEACKSNGLKADLIYTGQTGWMQGYPHGFLFDATPNDFVSGELERALLASWERAQPDVIFVEGQGALRNPSGPCGSEFLVSANATGVILQHDPARTHFVDHDHVRARVPDVPSEIDLIEAYGIDVLAVTLSELSWRGEKMEAYRSQLTERIGRPVICPLSEGVGALLPLIQSMLVRKKDESHV